MDKSAKPAPPKPVQAEKPKRRMGSSNAAAYQQMLDATEKVLREEGYGALTSRRVCEVAEVKHQLLYYYFANMDDLILSAFKRRTELGLDRLRQMLEKMPPLQAIWQFVTDGVDPNLTFEYIALANHHPGMREEVARFMEAARTMQLEALRCSPRGQRPELRLGDDPEVLVFLIQSIALMLERETSTGVRTGHDTVRQFVKKLIGAPTDPAN